MKQASSALFVCLVVLLLVGAFAFGRHVRLSATAPLRQADALAQQQAQHNQWTVEALGGASPASERSIAVADVSPSSRMTADDADSTDSSSASSDLFGSDSPLVTFQQVYELLKQQYVDRIPSDTPLAHGAVSALVASLDDPNSRFLEPGERTSIENEANGIYAGTGLVFTVKKVTVDGLLERQLTVIDPVVGSPAEKAGLKTGDVITDINSHWVVSFDPFAAQENLFKSLAKDPVSFNHAVDATEAKIKDGLTLPQAQALLDTTQTAPLVLTVLRNGQATKITVDGSQTTTVNDVISKLLPDGNGYIQFNDFSNTSSVDFQKAFATVSSSPGIVVDLRDCPGGSIDSALLIGQALAPNQSLGSVEIRYSHGTLDKSLGFAVKSEPLTYAPINGATIMPLSYTGRIVVLVNTGTANTAELFAAFLHERLGARIVGATTFGDGMAQTLFPMSDGSGFTLTTGLVKTAGDTIFEAKGITPDEVLAGSDVDGGLGLQKADEALSLKPLNVSDTAASLTGQKS